LCVCVCLRGDAPVAPFWEVGAKLGEAEGAKSGEAEGEKSG
jgi:hypothetical protein